MDRHFDNPLEWYKLDDEKDFEKFREKMLTSRYVNVKSEFDKKPAQYPYAVSYDYNDGGNEPSYMYLKYLYPQPDGTYQIFPIKI